MTTPQIILAAWFTAGLITAPIVAGWTAAYFWKQFPILQQEEGRFAEVRSRGIWNGIVCLMCPPVFVMFLFLSNFAEHGWMLKNPKP